MACYHFLNGDLLKWRRTDPNISGTPPEAGYRFQDILTFLIILCNYRARKEAILLALISIHGSLGYKYGVLVLPGALVRIVPRI